MTATPFYQSGWKNLGTPAGTERIEADNGGAVKGYFTTMELAGLSTVGAQVANSNGATSNTTLTAANVTGGSDTVYLTMTGAFGAAANITLPLYSAVEALTAGAAANPLSFGSSYILRIINPSGYTLTLVTNAGWTLNPSYGVATIPTESFRDFLVTLTSATAGTIQDVGSAAAASE